MKSPREIQAIAKILGGVPILGVLPGSLAARAGLRYGDIVLSMNGMLTDTFTEFLRAHDSSKEKLELEVFRDGARFGLVMSLPERRRSADSSSRLEIVYS